MHPDFAPPATTTGSAPLPNTSAHTDDEPPRKRRRNTDQTRTRATGSTNPHVARPIPPAPTATSSSGPARVPSPLTPLTMPPASLFGASIDSPLDVDDEQPLPPVHTHLESDAGYVERTRRITLIDLQNRDCFLCKHEMSRESGGALPTTATATPTPLEGIGQTGMIASLSTLHDMILDNADKMSDRYLWEFAAEIYAKDIRAPLQHMVALYTRGHSLDLSGSRSVPPVIPPNLTPDDFARHYTRHITCSKLEVTADIGLMRRLQDEVRSKIAIIKPDGGVDLDPAQVKLLFELGRRKHQLMGFVPALASASSSSSSSSSSKRVGAQPPVR